MFNSGNRGNQASNVAHNWAHQLNSPYKKDTHAGSLFYEGLTIYSYGYHFAIATHDKDSFNTVFFTTRSYSNTTAKHIQTVRNAVSHLKLIYCAEPAEASRGHHENNFASFLRAAESVAKNLEKAKKPEKYLLELGDIKHRVEMYCNHFDIEIPAKLNEVLNVGNKAEFAQYQERKAELEKAEAAQALREAKKKEAKELKEWRAFKRSRLYTRVNQDYLRLNTETNRVETSQGVEIPTEAARRFYKWVKSTIEAGGCAGDCKQTILHYEIQAIDAKFMKIGCHTIPIKEADKIAKVLNW